MQKKETFINSHLCVCIRGISYNFKILLFNFFICLIRAIVAILFMGNKIWKSKTCSLNYKESPFEFVN